MNVYNFGLKFALSSMCDFVSPIIVAGAPPRGGNSNKYLQGVRPNFSQRYRLCTLNRTYNLDYVSNNLQLSTIEEGLKSFRREAGEKPPRGVRKRGRVRAYKPK